MWRSTSNANRSQGLATIFFYPSTTLKNHKGGISNVKFSNNTFFKIVLYWCLDLIRHNIGTHLKHNKYIFDISIPFCHPLYLYATLNQCFTEFAVSGNVVDHAYMPGFQRRCWMRNCQTWWWWNNQNMAIFTRCYYFLCHVSSLTSLPITQSTHSLQSWP